MHSLKFPRLECINSNLICVSGGLMGKIGSDQIMCLCRIFKKGCFLR